MIGIDSLFDVAGALWALACVWAGSVALSRGGDE